MNWDARDKDDGVKMKLNHPIRKPHKMKKIDTLLIKCDDSTARQYIYRTLLRLLDSVKPASQIASSAFHAAGAARA